MHFLINFYLFFTITVTPKYNETCIIYFYYLKSVYLIIKFTHNLLFIVYTLKLIQNIILKLKFISFNVYLMSLISLNFYINNSKSCSTKFLELINLDIRKKVNYQLIFLFEQLLKLIKYCSLNI